MKLTRILIALLALTAIVLQYVLLVTNEAGPSSAMKTLQFFSYFTILSNLAVVLTFALPLIAPRAKITTALSSTTARAGIACTITIVGLIYAGLLRMLWQPQGLQFIVDATLHYAVPLLYVGYWLSCEPRGQLHVKSAAIWLLFPLIYVLWVFVHGAWLGFYPYPFVDVKLLGLETALTNAALLSGTFFIIGLMFVGFDRVMARKKPD